MSGSGGLPLAGSTGGGIDALKRAWAFLWDDAEPTLRLRVAGALAFMIGAKLLTIQVPFIFKYAIDAIEDPAAASIPALLVGVAPTSMMLLYGATRACADAMTQLRNAVFVAVTEGALRRMARRTFRHLHSMELSFHLNRQTGALTRVVERGTSAVGTLLSTSILQVVPLTFEVTVVSALLARNCGVAFAAATAGAIGMYTVFTFSMVRWRTAIRRAQNAADTQASQRFTDSMINYETVKYFDATGHEEARYDEAKARYQLAATRTQLSLASLNFGQNLIFGAGLSASMWLSAQEVMAGRMGVGDMVMVQGLIFQLTMPLNILGTVYNQVRQAATDLQTLADLQRQQPAIVDAPDASPLVLSGGRVEFDAVHFSYAPGQELLKGVSFVVEPGQTLAIVGPSGSGKSSVLRLLYRFFDVQRGEIRVDGQDVRGVQLDSLRASLGVVPQDVVLFNDTIRYNLAYGDPDATEEDVTRVAKQARIHDTIMRMPSGYETVVGERGLKLSGGEKQRIAIARARRARTRAAAARSHVPRSHAPRSHAPRRAAATDRPRPRSVPGRRASEGPAHPSVRRGDERRGHGHGERDLPRAPRAQQARRREADLRHDRARAARSPTTRERQHTQRAPAAPAQLLFAAQATGRKPARRRAATPCRRQNLSTVVDADQIVVLKDGVVHECGTHHELLALRGEYHSMWNVQRDKHPLPTQSADA